MKGYNNGKMQIHTDVSLKNYSTMRLGDTAKALAEVHNKEELVEAVDWAEKHHLPLLMLGGGSNVIFSDGYPGLVMVNRIHGFEVIHENWSGVIIKVGAGEDWDSVVKRTVEMRLSGLEFLSAIPGTAGATPVQNVGAYGQEIANVFVELEAYDLRDRQFATLDKEACKFSYRNSMFKSLTDRRYIITSVTLRLSKSAPQPPFYESLQKYLDERGIKDYTPQIIRGAVIAIRSTKLPDPAKVANTGSFFKNPILTSGEFEDLSAKHPDVPHWPMRDGTIKLPAGWLIEHAGLKGYRSHGMKTLETNALVFINESAHSFADLMAFKGEIVAKVQEKFGVTLEQEPELL